MWEKAGAKNSSQLHVGWAERGRRTMEGSFIKHIHIKTYKDTHITAEKQVEPFYNHPASSKDLFIGTRVGIFG